MEDSDFLLDSYDYGLPESLIAQQPPETRGQSRLMVLRRDPEKEIIHAWINDISSHLPPNSLLVANNARVAHARLYGVRPGGGKAEFLLLTPLPLITGANKNGFNSCEASGLLRPLAKIREGMEIKFSDSLYLKVLQKGAFGKCRVELRWQGQIGDIVEKTGKLPLPPYIKRKALESDECRYQTVYATASGSCAAPTAGLHFTPEALENLKNQGHEWITLTLHVGYGTFSPVRASDIRDHQMHEEYIEIPENAANAINAARRANRPVIAIGTTSARALEGMYAKEGKIAPCSGSTNIFLYPGKTFSVMDGLLTNFHLPKSSLMMLVSAFCGRKRLLAAYEEAIRANYRFFSYGDAMLII